MEEKRFARGGRWSPFPHPLQGSHDRDLQWANGRGYGGPEVPQHIRLKTIPRNVLIVLRYVTWGEIFLKKILPGHFAAGGESWSF